MKGYLLGVMLATFSFAAAQSDVKFVDIGGKDLAILLDLKTDKTCSELFVFQHENVDLKSLTSDKKYTLITHDRQKIKIRSEGKILTFTIDPGYQDKSETVFHGYGISHRKGKYQMVAHKNPQSLQDITSLNGKMYTGSVIGNCDSGGPGSTSCSSGGGVVAGGSTCSVACAPGYYSCCMDAVNECRCKRS